MELQELDKRLGQITVAEVFIPCVPLRSSQPSQNVNQFDQRDFSLTAERAGAVDLAQAIVLVGIDCGYDRR
jgi:hypothetical protein